MGSLLGRQGCRRHARLGVRFQQDQAIQTARFVPAEVRPAYTATAQGIMGAHSIVQTGVKNRLRHIGGQNVA